MRRSDNLGLAIQHYAQRWRSDNEALEEMEHLVYDDPVATAFVLLQATAEERRTIRRYLFSRFGVKIRHTLKDSPYTPDVSSEDCELTVAPDYRPASNLRKVHRERLPRSAADHMRFFNLLENYGLADIAYFHMVAILVWGVFRIKEAENDSEAEEELFVMAYMICRCWVQVYGMRTIMAVCVLREFLQDKTNGKRYPFQESFLEELTVSVAGAVRSRISLERNKRLRSALKRLREGLEEMIERERDEVQGDPDREAKAWANKLAAAADKRARLQDMAAEGLITFDELGTKLMALEEERELARRKLQALEDHRARLHDLERDKDVLLDRYTGLLPEALDNLAPEERHHVCRMLKLRVNMHPDRMLEVSGVLGEDLGFCESEPSSV